MFLGIDDNAGLIYESAGSNPDRPVLPTPTVSKARLIDTPSDWQLLGASLRSNPNAWLFREDYFTIRPCKSLLLSGVQKDTVTFLKNAS